MDLDLWQGKMFQVVKRSRGNQNHGTLWLQWNIILEYLRVHSPTLWLWRAGDIVSVSHRVTSCPIPWSKVLVDHQTFQPNWPSGVDPASRSGTQPCCYAKLPSSSTNIFRNWCQGPKDSKMRINKNIMRIPRPLFLHQDLPLLHSQQTWCISQLLLVEMPTSAPNPAGNGTSRTIVLYILVALKIFHGSHT